MPRQILKAQAQLEKFTNPRLPHIEACRPELRVERVGLVLDSKGRRGYEPVERIHVEAQNLPGLARRIPAAIRDDIGGHRGAQRAVSLIDVLNGALALVAARKIEIDVGPLAALFGKEALEEQLHFHRIHRRNSERITNSAVRRRAAALDEDVVLQAELNDVPNDQEVTFEAQLFDERQLALDLTPGVFIVRTEAVARAFLRALAEK